MHTALAGNNKRFAGNIGSGKVVARVGLGKAEFFCFGDGLAERNAVIKTAENIRKRSGHNAGKM